MHPKKIFATVYVIVMLTLMALVARPVCTAFVDFITDEPKWDFEKVRTQQ